MLHYKNILVPIDFSDEAASALEWAIDLAKEENKSTIYLLHVLPYVVDPTYLMGWTDDLVGLRWDEAKADLMAWKNKVPKTINCLPFLRKGNIANEISRVCEERQVDLVVMSNRERRGLARMIHPNASEQAIRTASCPVMVLSNHKDVIPMARRLVV